MSKNINNSSSNEGKSKRIKSSSTSYDFTFSKDATNICKSVFTDSFLSYPLPSNFNSNSKIIIISSERRFPKHTGNKGGDSYNQKKSKLEKNLGCGSASYAMECNISKSCKCIHNIYIGFRSKNTNASNKLGGTIAQIQNRKMELSFAVKVEWPTKQCLQCKTISLTLVLLPLDSSKQVLVSKPKLVTWASKSKYVDSPILFEYDRSMDLESYCNSSICNNNSNENETDNNSDDNSDNNGDNLELMVDDNIKNNNNNNNNGKPFYFVPTPLINESLINNSSNWTPSINDDPHVQSLLNHLLQPNYINCAPFTPLIPMKPFVNNSNNNNINSSNEIDSPISTPILSSSPSHSQQAEDSSDNNSNNNNSSDINSEYYPCLIDPNSLDSRQFGSVNRDIMGVLIKALVVNNYSSAVIERFRSEFEATNFMNDWNSNSISTSSSSISNSSLYHL